MANIFIRSDEDQDGEEASLTPVPRTSITPVTVPKLSIDTKSPRQKGSKIDVPGSSTSTTSAPKPKTETPRTLGIDEKSAKDAKSNFLKKLVQ